MPNITTNHAITYTNCQNIWQKQVSQLKLLKLKSINQTVNL